MKQTIRFALLFSLFVGIIACSKNSTKPQTVTFSGTVTLQGRTDHSGATVMLFKPITLDTALTNLNSRYPGIGITINQRTEFYWREHSPVYRTTTNASGNWKIENVAKGEYHIVVQADSFGWRIKYNASAGTHNFTLSKAIRWSGTYSQNVTVPAGSFVEVVGNTVFTDAATLTIEPGVIVEMQNNAVLEIEGYANISGAKGNEIYFVPDEINNNLRVILDQAHNSTINYICLLNVYNGLYIKNSNNIVLLNSRFIKGLQGLEFLNTQNILVKNCVISGQQIGVYSNDSNINFKNNILNYIVNTGFKSINEDSSSLVNNIVENCGNAAISINKGGSQAGYFQRLNYRIYYNDFKGNNIHIYVGRNAKCISNFNNFLKEKDWIIYTDVYTYVDTLDFKQNYFGYETQIDIEERILDRMDRIGQTLEGPIVDFSDFKFNSITW